MTNSNLRIQFLSFLSELASGEFSPAIWEQYAVAHYQDPAVELARSRLVQASISIENGQWSKAPSSIQQLAHELHAQLSKSGT